ncbi:hypothetical protein LXL04_018965 [Taraxacum kok-saghyz]
MNNLGIIKKYEKPFGPEVPYLNVIGVVMHIQYIVISEQDDSRIESNTFLSTSLIPNKLCIHFWRSRDLYLAQIKEEFIKGDKSNHISPKFFFTHGLQKECNINIQKIQSSNSLTDLFTKSLPTSKFKKMVRNIGMRRFKEIKLDLLDEASADYLLQSLLTKNKRYQISTCGYYLVHMGHESYSWITWLKDGDEISRFFHNTLKIKNRKCNIRGLMLNGCWVEEVDQIKQEAHRSFGAKFHEECNSRPTFSDPNFCVLSDVDRNQKSDLELRESPRAQWTDFQKI